MPPERRPPERRHSLPALLRQLAYGCFAAGGVAVLAVPSRAAAAYAPTWAVYVWAGFYLAGGVGGLAGIWLRHWAGELMGLPLLITGSLSLAVAVLFHTATGHPDGALLLIGALLGAQVAGLGVWWVDRWQQLRATTTRSGPS